MRSATEQPQRKTRKKSIMKKMKWYYAITQMKTMHDMAYDTVLGACLLERREKNNNNKSRCVPSTQHAVQSTDYTNTHTHQRITMAGCVCVCVRGESE